MSFSVKLTLYSDAAGWRLASENIQEYKHCLESKYFMHNKTQKTKQTHKNNKKNNRKTDNYKNNMEEYSAG